MIHKSVYPLLLLLLPMHVTQYVSRNHPVSTPLYISLVVCIEISPSFIFTVLVGGKNLRDLICTVKYNRAK